MHSVRSNNLICKDSIFFVSEFNSLERLLNYLLPAVHGSNLKSKIQILNLIFNFEWVFQIWTGCRVIQRPIPVLLPYLITVNLLMFAFLEAVTSAMICSMKCLHNNGNYFKLLWGYYVVNSCSGITDIFQFIEIIANRLPSTWQPIWK